MNGVNIQLGHLQTALSERKRQNLITRLLELHKNVTKAHQMRDAAPHGTWEKQGNAAKEIAGNLKDLMKHRRSTGSARNKVSEQPQRCYET